VQQINLASVREHVKRQQRRWGSSARCMLTNAGVCWRTLAYADVLRKLRCLKRMRTYVKRQQRRWSRSASRWRMLAYADVCHEAAAALEQRRQSLTLRLDAMVMDILKIILKVTCADVC
jgi:hypothetical protein